MKGSKIIQNINKIMLNGNKIIITSYFHNRVMATGKNAPPPSPCPTRVGKGPVLIGVVQSNTILEP